MNECVRCTFQRHSVLYNERILPNILLQAVAENFIWNDWSNWYQPERADGAEDG